VSAGFQTVRVGFACFLKSQSDAEKARVESNAAVLEKPVGNRACVTTIKASRRRQLKLASWDGGFLG
jgi:hypothetical protein